jgi:hypothetical protein
MPREEERASDPLGAVARNEVTTTQGRRRCAAVDLRCPGRRRGHPKLWAFSGPVFTDDDTREEEMCHRPARTPREEERTSDLLGEERGAMPYRSLPNSVQPF